MNHPNEGNPEDTSEKLEETSEETKKEELEEAPQKEEEPEEEEVPEEPEEWTCDICDEPRVGDAYKISGYHELICGQCYDRGLMWSIREAWKWRSQVRIDVLRKPRDE